MGASRGFAVDGDDVRLGFSQPRRPGAEAVAKEPDRQRIYDIVEGVVGRNARAKGRRPRRNSILRTTQCWICAKSSAPANVLHCPISRISPKG
jgi:hypothetical protein